MSRVTFDPALSVSNEGVVQGTASSLDVVGEGASVAVVNGHATITITSGADGETGPAGADGIAELRLEGADQGEVSILDFVGGGAGVSVSGSIGTIRIPGAESGNGEIEEVPIYVQSGFDQSGSPVATDGNDLNDGRTIGAPIRTLRQALEKYPRPVEGMQYVFLLAGGTDGVVNPWVDPVSVRSYVPWRINLQSYAYHNGYCFRGPRRMVTTVTPTFSSVVADGVRTKWNFSTSLGPTNGVRGSFLRVFLGDQREPFFAQPINQNTSGSLWITDNIGGTNWNAYRPGGVYSDDTQVACVRPAVLLTPTDGASGLLVCGDGPANPGDRANDVNWARTFEYLQIGHCNVTASGVVSFQNVLFTDIAKFRGDAVRFDNSVFNGNRCWITCATVTNSLGSSVSLANEFTGREIATGAFPAGDPQNPEYGSDLTIIGPTFIGDYYQGNKGGQLHVRKAFTGCCPDNPEDGSISVVGPDSQFFQTNNAYIYLAHENANGVGLWAKGGGQARINTADYGTSNARIQIDSPKHLKVSRGLPIQIGTGLGEFNQAAGYNGHFSRALETTVAGKAQHDHSRIYDKSWEDANEGGQDPFYGGS